ncbi:hypothetical protein SAMN04515654_12168 [Halanaerobium congolense]|uniref:Uncharacterized protein n=1 Tax=Halanaerobium congolense TaxID=54121 RepID=A0A1G8PXU2_9FIRM|nr:hypothetical protein [Halanaerobium congolense]SDI97324.1 hypothetical protein SAMN04515654_12168 [Halanaerobium congolense]SES92230.1 hypothetical protein SAMN04515653_10468 [Halanaerobium congolense]
MPEVSVKGESYYVSLEKFPDDRIGYWARANVNGEVVNEQSSLVIKNMEKAKENVLERIKTKIASALKRQDEL